MIAKHFRKIPALVAVLLLLERSRAANVHFMSIKDESQSKQAHTANVGQIFAFAKHFQNNMVLQRAPARANIYGFSSEIGQKVICEFSPNSMQSIYYSTTVQPGPAPGIGVWSFTLDPMEANVTAFVSVFSEIGSLTLNNLIFGDVWICSGQSNMEFTVIQMLRAEEEMNDAQNYPNIRIMTVAEDASNTPLYDVSVIQQDWTSPSKDSIGGAAWSYFSAVCWLYGKNIHKALGVPIGLVATDWGGTPVEAWSSPEALAKCGVTTNSEKKQQSGSFSRYLDKLPPAVKIRLTGPQNNSVLWNAMVNPLLGMTIYGAIWYQGEADAIVTVMMNRYNCTFPTMITDWRKNFNKFSNGQTNASFPFGFVQLAPNTADPTISVGFPDIRFHQTADWGYIPNSDMPNVFMAVTMDLPDFNSIYDS
jgi:sialate O-acetylesterase